MDRLIQVLGFLMNKSRIAIKTGRIMRSIDVFIVPMGTWSDGSAAPVM